MVAGIVDTVPSVSRLTLSTTPDNFVFQPLEFVSLPDEAVPPEVRWQTFHGG